MSDGVSIFGIRHHGPGCARSLRVALQRLQPDCVLIEGPAGAEPLLAHLPDAGLQPPVALLSHAVDQPQLAVFHPFAVYSPEWQALQWAAQAGVPVQFMDVPATLALAWQKAQREPDAKDIDPQVEESVDSTIGSAAADAPQVSGAAGLADEDIPHDPLDWLARAAGHGDGETWWNHLVEERGDGEGLFEAIAQAMTELRAHAPQRPQANQAHEDIREAHMRSCLREARKVYKNIAVVCGAWHVPALASPGTAAADARLLKGLPKLKAQTTWVPWTYRHLSLHSGYGAGVAAPGWYDYLWRSGGDRQQRAAGWYARVARLLRENGLDCSSAHLIEAARLADTLAALRERPAPGLDEISEATRSVICNGDDTPMRLIAEALLVGDAMGSVPSSVPTVPLQRDLEAEQSRLRLKPEALSKTLDLDLRNDTDLQRSHLLHRLALLDIAWGEIANVGRSARGTFHEVWTLAWQPGFQIDLIVASRYGQTVRQAAGQRAVEQARAAQKLAELARLVDRVLLAHLPDAVPLVAAELEARAATNADPLGLLAALPALANVYRYGNVRRTDSEQVAHLIDSMLLRACIGLPLALHDLDGEPAEQARATLLAADRAIALRQGEEQTEAWQRALRVIALSAASTPLLRGLCARLLLDVDVLPAVEIAQQLQLNLSAGAEPLAAAQWLDGFLNRNATVLLHGDAVWPLIDAWLAGLADEHFIRVVPLVRRTFAEFEAADRRDLGERVKKPVASAQVSAAKPPAWDETRARRALPLLRELFGVSDET
jgi:Family of unknown function (DUF5682)